MSNELYEVKVINENKIRKYLVVASSIQEAINSIFSRELKRELYDPDDPLYELNASVINFDDATSPMVLANNVVWEEN